MQNARDNKMLRYFKWFLRSKIKIKNGVPEKLVARKEAQKRRVYLETETEKFPLIFTLNVMESIQEKYRTIEAWSNLIQRDGEPDIKALKFFITEAINEGLEIEAEKTGKKMTPITAKKLAEY